MEQKKPSLHILYFILILVHDSAAILTAQGYRERILSPPSEYWTLDEFSALSLQLESWILAGGDTGEILFAAAIL